MPRRSILRKEIRQLRRDLRKSDLRSVDLRFEAVDRSTDIATGELRGRLAILNELRGDVVSRGEFSSEIKALDAKLDLVVNAQNAQSGGGKALDKLGSYLVAGVGLALVAGDAILRATGH